MNTNYCSTKSKPWIWVATLFFFVVIVFESYLLVVHMMKKDDCAKERAEMLQIEEKYTKELENFTP